MVKLTFEEVYETALRIAKARTYAAVKSRAISAGD